MAKSGDLNDLILLIFNTRRLIAERYRQASGFSLLQLETLRYIAENENPTMKDVADYLAVTPPSATALIELLVKSGKIKRLSTKGDRRVVCLSLTIGGKKALAAGFKEKTARMRALLETLSADDRKNLARILKNLLK